MKSTPAQLTARARYVARHPERILAGRRARVAYDREYHRVRHAEIKIEVLSHYGPSGQLCCSWFDCHISDVDMLVLDHTADNGARQKIELGGSSGRGHNFYRWLKSHGFPDGYQTLCCNHNHKKEILRSRSKS